MFDPRRDPVPDLEREAGGTPKPEPDVEPASAAAVEAAADDAGRRLAAGAASDLEALLAERADLHDRLLRLAAEFDNYRKRTAREWREHKERATAEVLREMLELADNLERALATPAAEGPVLHKGVQLILQQLQAKLLRFGVQPMEAEGQAFDPARHEAVLLVDAPEVESQHVVGVVQRGYVQHGEVLRPARVTVAR